MTIFILSDISKKQPANSAIYQLIQFLSLHAFFALRSGAPNGKNRLNDTIAEKNCKGNPYAPNHYFSANANLSKKKSWAVKMANYNV